MRQIKKQQKTNEERNAFLLKLMRALGILSFMTAGILLILLLMMQVDPIRNKYDQYIMYIQDFEDRVASLRTNWLSLIVIFLLYLLRSLSAIYPFPALYIITAMVFKPVESFLINIANMTFVIAFRYFTGVQMGEGFWNGVLKKNQYISAMFEVDARGNPLVLFALRFVPIFPFNTVSHLYGSFEYPFVKYVLISVAALVPRLISYSFIGKNVYNPLSSSFFVPLIFLSVITGISFFLMYGVLQVNFRRHRNKEALADAGADPAAVITPADGDSAVAAETATDDRNEQNQTTDDPERSNKNE